MKTPASVSIVIPAFNEEECLLRTLEETVRAATDTFETFEMIVVNDGSTDGTLPIAEAFARGHPNVLVLSKPNGGIGSALKYGFARAKGEYFTYSHADGQFDFREVALLIAALADHDVVIGFKKNLVNYTFFRKLNSHGLRMTLSILFGLPYWDVNFVHAYRREAYLQIIPHSDGVFYHAEIAIRAHWKNMRIKTLPVTVHERRGGEAKGASFRSIFRTLKDLLMFRLNTLFQRPPDNTRQSADQ